MPEDELNPLSSADIPDPVAFLMHAEPTVDGRMPWSSNATFLVTMHCGDVEQQAIYKPVRGERALWDFEPGLHKRERAAYLLSEHLGIGVVPPTVIREGPFGEGSFQWFVDADHSEHYFTIHEQYMHHHDQLREIAVLDVLANNTDRKSGHCLLAHGRVWAIDNGLCFSAPFKLRTVIWEFAGEPLSDELRRAAASASDVPAELAELLDDDEVDAIVRRARRLAARATFPVERHSHGYPWPLV
jgi:uncharacterized repeat protein (TIGR03843 family)